MGNSTLFCTSAKISLDSRQNDTDQMGNSTLFCATTKMSLHGRQNMTGWVMRIIQDWQDFDRQLKITNTKHKIIKEKAFRLRDPPETSTSYFAAFEGS